MLKHKLSYMMRDFGTPKAEALEKVLKLMLQYLRKRANSSPRQQLMNIESHPFNICIWGYWHSHIFYP